MNFESVSRETQDEPPATAAAVFGAALPGARRYAELLATTGVARGVVGPAEIPRLWERHLLNCAVVAPAFDTARTVCDVGSGGGLPGIVVALMRPHLEVVLLEPLLRRAEFLSTVVGELGLRHVRVERARAEDHRPGRDGYDVVTARAVAPLRRLVPWTVPLCRPKGVVVALKGQRAGEEVEAARGVLKTWNIRECVVETYGDAVVDPPTTVVRLQRE